MTIFVGSLLKLSNAQRTQKLVVSGNRLLKIYASVWFGSLPQKKAQSKKKPLESPEVSVPDLVSTFTTICLQSFPDTEENYFIWNLTPRMYWFSYITGVTP
ncbi:hypothetical protein [Nostoc sp. PA-18-2419]|uniref:hypothetical protein n=1 Tax=Nostoc sp. PA-18-2419 TaxID=2575443 RepID=UPI001108BBEB|nr:hypothetical protein [Nostoc sp. PA-18-2419]